jgi:3'(2'), 5'-bisphosphate nucleotidase
MADLDHAALLDRLMGAVLEAGACLLRHKADGVKSEKKSDGSPVSAADREAEDILCRALADAAPEIPVIGEEAVSAGKIPKFERCAFLVDALDGTKEFLAGGDDFTVNIGLVQDGAPVFGIVLAPASGRVFATAGRARAVAGWIEPALLGTGAQPVLSAITTAAPDSRGVRVLSSRSHRSAETDQFLEWFTIRDDVRMGSSVKFGIIAAGEADLYPRFGPTSAWDIAAGHAVLAAAGGTVTTPEGLPIVYLDKARMGEREPFLNPPFVAWGRASMVASLRLP